MTSLPAGHWLPLECKNELVQAIRSWLKAKLFEMESRKPDQERDENNVNDAIPIDSSNSFASWKFEHVAIRVPDFETAVAWYREKPDFRPLKSSPLGDKIYGFLIVSAVDASFSVELIAGPRADRRPAYEDLASSLKLSGLHHVAFRVLSVDDTIDELQRRGVDVVYEPRDVPKLALRVAFFADPWGNLFEVIQEISL